MSALQGLPEKAIQWHLKIRTTEWDEDGYHYCSVWGLKTAMFAIEVLRKTHAHHLEEIIRDGKFWYRMPIEEWHNYREHSQLVMEEAIARRMAKAGMRQDAADV